MVTSSGTESSTRQTGNWWLLVVVSLSIVMGFQAVRVFVTTLVYTFGERYGQTLAAVPALLVFLSPFAIPLLAPRLRPRRLLFISVGGLAVARLLMQLARNIDLIMILSGVVIVLGLIGLALVLSWLSASDNAARRRPFAQGIFLGMTVEAALQGAFLTWDYVWQSGAIPVIAALVVSGLALLALWQVRSAVQDQQFGGAGFRAALPAAGLGTLLVLEILFLQNIAFVASSSNTSMEVALAIVMLGNALAFAVLGRIAQQGLLIRLIAGAVFVAAAALLPILSGIVVIALVLIGQGVAAGLLNSMLSGLAPEKMQPGIWRTSVVAGIGSLLFIVLTILYYISTLITLPFSYTILPLAAAIVVFLAAFAPSRDAAPPDLRLAALPLALLAIPLALLLTRPAIASDSAGTDKFRLLNYNIHQAINTEGWLDPEAIAQVIEAQQPALIALQEVSRGWLIAGSLDVAEWLSRRLQVPYIYAPGHDYQFGNMILTRMPIKEWSFTRLPLQNVPLGRGLIRAALDVGGGKTLTIINTHLSAYAATEDRIPQVQKVIETWNNTPRTLIVGDMNARLGEADMDLFLNAGLRSAQDVTNNESLLTFSSAKPVERIDWIFGTADIEFSEFVIPSTTASDHLPLAVTVAVQ